MSGTRDDDMPYWHAGISPPRIREPELTREENPERLERPTVPIPLLAEPLLGPPPPGADRPRRDRRATGGRRSPRRVAVVALAAGALAAVGAGLAVAERGGRDGAPAEEHGLATSATADPTGTATAAEVAGTPGPTVDSTGTRSSRPDRTRAVAGSDRPKPSRTRTGRDGTPTARPGAARPRRPVMVLIDPAELVGKPVATVRERLAALGTTSVIELPALGHDGDLPAGTVVDVAPTGEVPRSAVVVLRVS